MSQRSSHHSIAETNRLVAVSGLLQLRGNVLIALLLVLLISGGAG
jgi:hypothetical protein